MKERAQSPANRTRRPPPAGRPDVRAALAAADGNFESRSLVGRLATATPSERAALLLERLDIDPHLAGLHGESSESLALSGVSLSPAALRQHLSGDEHERPSINPETGGVVLAGADLRRASLRSADLTAALLEEADLKCADLCGSLLDSARMNGASLAGALLEDASLKGASLRFADLEQAVLEGADLTGTDLWGAQLAGAELSRTVMAGACLQDANLSNADLTGANLTGATLNGASLRGARLVRADLRGASLAGADLTGARLQHANLERLDLSDCRLEEVHLGGVRLDHTRLNREQLGPAIGEEKEADLELARIGYQALELNFIDLADPEAARWAYLLKRRMEKRATLRRSSLLRQAGRPAAAAGELFQYFGDVIAEMVCDYGEGLSRVGLTLLIVDLLFFTLYLATGSVVHSDSHLVTREPVDILVFTLLAMTNATPAVGLLPASAHVHLLTGVQALLCIFLVGLAGFVLGNRIRH